MKKLIAVMAFAGVLSVPSVLLADAVWYGSLRGGVEMGGGNDAGFKDGGSRWGIKGSNELSEGLSAVYRFEHKIDSGDASQPGGRLAYVGLSGGFGNLTLGQIGNASYGSTGAIVDNSFHYGNAYTGGDADGTTRQGDALSYSNSLGGVSVQLDLLMDPARDSDGAIDEAQLGLSMNLGDFGKLAISHVNVEDTMMDGMVDLMIRPSKTNTSNPSGMYTIEDGVVTPDSTIVWETEDLKEFDSKSAKSLKLTHKIGGMTVKAMKVYHAAEGATGALADDAKVRMNKDGKLVVVSECTGTACTAKSTTVWVSEANVRTVATGDNIDLEGVKEYTVHNAENETVVTTATATVTEVTAGRKSNHIAAEFGLGGITAFVGYSQVESNMKGAKKDKITHYGIRGGLGDSGVNFLVQLRSEDLQGSAPMDADRDPYVVNMSKSLGDGASAYIEHGTSDAKDVKAKTRIGMIVNF